MKSKYSFFTSSEIKPTGWLRRQLELQADGLCGNLDKVWPDIRDSKWIGGDREGWERVPYWLDGFLPMAYLLDDEDRKARAQKYIEKIIENQEEDGWICPNGETPRDQYDTWAVQLIAKTLLVYYDCTKDERIPKVLYRLSKNYYDLLSAGTITLDPGPAARWGQARWFELCITLNRLCEWYPNEEWIPALAKILAEQGTDWEAMSDRWEKPMNEWTYETHIVNVAMMLKYEAVSHELLGNPYENIAEKLYQQLLRFNRTPLENFTGDECLSGLSPIQGTECCAVVEQMYSYEWLYAYTGDRKWAERLELLAFNSLPATITDDMWAHQYVQQSNQVDCTPLPGRSVFRTNGPYAHVFGLEPNFGCCTANFGQGWPKLALSAFMKAKDGVVSAVPLPCELNTEWHGVPVKVTLETNYPFRNEFTYRITAEKATSMKLRIRIPSFARNITVNGKATAKKPYVVMGGFPAGETVIRIAFEADPHLVSSPNNLKHVRYGSLVFSVPLEVKTELREYVAAGVERKAPYCDYLFSSDSDWNWCYTSDQFTVEECAIDQIPFSSVHPPLRIKAKVAHVDWGLSDGYRRIPAKLPQSRKPLDEPQEILLSPYGCAKLRMTEIPLVKK